MIPFSPNRWEFCKIHDILNEIEVTTYFHLDYLLKLKWFNKMTMHCRLFSCNSQTWYSLDLNPRNLWIFNIIYMKLSSIINGILFCASYIFMIFTYNIVREEL